jgi:hypothetical protein
MIVASPSRPNPRKELTKRYLLLILLIDAVLYSNRIFFVILHLFFKNAHIISNVKNSKFQDTLYIQTVPIELKSYKTKNIPGDNSATAYWILQFEGNIDSVLIATSE